MYTNELYSLASYVQMGFMNLGIYHIVYQHIIVNELRHDDSSTDFWFVIGSNYSVFLVRKSEQTVELPHLLASIVCKTACL